MPANLAQLLITGEDRTGPAFDSVRRNVGSVENIARRVGQAVAGAFSVAAVINFGRAVFDEITKVEQAQAKLQGAYRATGGVVGLTLQELNALADQVEASTLFDAEQIRDATAVLLTFKSVQGDTFRDAIARSADLAALLGSDVTGAALQLGKALEDPLRGLDALRRSGVSFSDQQKEVIQQLVESGRLADAQRIILQALAGQVQGTAEALRSGLTGATKELNDEWGNLLESIGKTPAVSKAAEGSIVGLSAALRGLRELIEETGTSGPRRDIIAAAGLGQGTLLTPEQGGPDRSQFPVGRLRLENVAEANERAAAKQRAATEKRRREEEEQASRDADARKEAAKKAAREAEEVARARQQARIAAFGDIQDAGRQEQRDIDERNAARQKEREELARLRDSYVQMIDPIQKYRDQLAEIDDLEARGLLNAVQATEARFKVNEQIDEAVRGTDRLARSTDSAAEAAKRFGLTFGSALEDAIVRFDNLRDVARGFVEDVARLFVRQAVTEPLAKNASTIFEGVFSGLFSLTPLQLSGPFATGGSFTVGGSGGTDSTTVAFRATPGELVTVTPPNKLEHRGGGATVVNVYIDSRTDQAQVRALAMEGAMKGLMLVRSEISRGGPLARMVGAAQ